MFFLGISAHFMIFLLIPALIVVGFYFRGTAGMPEAAPLLPGNVVYVSPLPLKYENAYLYKTIQEQIHITEETDKNIYPVNIEKTVFPSSFFYSSKIIFVRALRAPPHF